jgi:hypothetical protein
VAEGKSLSGDGDVVAGSPAVSRGPSGKAGSMRATVAPLRETVVGGTASLSWTPAWRPLLEQSNFSSSYALARSPAADIVLRRAGEVCVGRAKAA